MVPTRDEKPTTPRRGLLLAGLLVRRVTTFPLAVLLHLNTLTIVHLVLHRDVIATLALLAGQNHLDSLFVLSHHFSLTTLVLPRTFGPAW